MGLQLRQPLWEVQQLIMKQFVVLLAFVSPLALAEAEASYGLHGGALGYAGAVGVAAAPVAVAAAPVAVAQRVATAPHCQTTYDTITSQQCTPASEPVCHTRTITQTETRTEQQCSSRPVEECHAVPRPVTEEVCTQTSVNVAHSSNVVGHTSGVAGVAVAPAAAAVGVAGGVQAVGYGAGLINHRIAKRE